MPTTAATSNAVTSELFNGKAEWPRARYQTTPGPSFEGKLATVKRATIATALAKTTDRATQLAFERCAGSDRQDT
jgi:hypothetical protein